MRKTKKMMALALAASMMLGSSAVAFAAEGDTTPGGTGTVSGTGEVEGHVNKEVLNVILPTVPSGQASAFAYTMDPERLIQGTDAAKYEEGTVFPAADVDTGVYFLTDTKTYSNESNTYQVVNKSSCDVDLTVKVKATQSSAKDITLASSNGVSTTAPELYLGLKVGSSEQAVSATEATVNKTLAGNKNNFEITVNTKDDGSKEYAYKEKDSTSAWKAMNISLTGTVSKLDIAADTTAPTVDVTWSWAKAADNATPSTDAVEFAEGPQVSANSSGLITMTGFTAEQNYASMVLVDGEGTEWDITVAPYTWNGDSWNETTGGNATMQLGDKWKSFLIEKGGSVQIKLTLTDGKVITATTTIS